MAAASPDSVRIVGWTPRASPRTSPIAVSSSVVAASSKRGRFGRRLLRDLEPHRERDKALLGAIVEVALDAPPLRIGRLHDAHPRGTHLLELGAHLGGQPLVLERESGRIADRFDEPRILDLDQRVMDEDAEQLVAALEPRHRARRVTDRQVDRLPGRIDVARPGRGCEGELQARVAECPGEDVAKTAERHAPPELHDEARHPSPVQARAQEGDQQADRQDHRDDEAQGRAGWAVEEGDAGLEADRAHERIGRGQRRLDREGDDDRQQGPPPGRGRVAPVPPQRGQDQRDHRHDSEHHGPVRDDPVDLLVRPDREDVADAVRHAGDRDLPERDARAAPVPTRSA